MDSNDKIALVKLLERNGFEQDQIENTFNMLFIYDESNRLKPIGPTKLIEITTPEETDLPPEAYGMFADGIEFDDEMVTMEALFAMGFAAANGRETIPDCKPDKPEKIEVLQQML